MKTARQLSRGVCAGLVLCAGLYFEAPGHAAGNSSPEVGIAVRDITPELPIRLAGYAGRKRPADKLDHALVAQALALRNPSGERFVFLALDNCEVSHAFMQPVLRELADRFQLGRGEVAVVSSHTHSAPVLDQTLTDMVQPSSEDLEQIAKYSRLLRAKLVEAVGAALADCQPATLEHGLGRAGFAMNRRVYRGDSVVFGDNPNGPTDWDVPVLRVRGTNGAVRAILFGYACHGTSVRSGEDWYAVSGEYMAYARQHLEAHQPGAAAMFLMGMGADSDPAPRGQLLDAKRHGLELAGAVIGVLNRPMRPVRGALKLAYEEVELPLAVQPSREKLEQDAGSGDIYVKLRAEAYLKRLNAGQPSPGSVKLPVAILRLGDDLTFVLMGGEVVVDYSRQLKRLLAGDYPWPVGYAYEVPCYIPTARLIKEGGYETESSMIYYGFYGPFRGEVERLLLERLEALANRVRTRS
ncbi:MAG TPA: neutral/alkaline non-lysosomal ceramidase N-terminal domain-containing protein [Candidatus Paceibacterota bacterium]|nr:neutral/alkaline non-lysosomal ceramidase N-terminal domain-containing protein [Verrucomicrobiota bacterium]HSA11339.1 neutral/alkaline non-lysosomal ceramidase N-terminal domain-containing protein [Candidatus Paceibacterota bacterium]